MVGATDRPSVRADAADYAALVLPGGVANPDALRLDVDAVAFVRRFVEPGRPVAAICHAAWTLVEADVLRGRTLASWPSLQTDIRNPDDLPAFNDALVAALDAS